MDTRHEVISAFLDDEPFDLEELESALGDPAGRTLLIDLVALRQMVQPEATVPMMSTRPPRRSVWRVATAAAGLALTLAGGYLAGQHSVSPSSLDAPPPTRVVQASPILPPGDHR
jgi:hypothetical protein